MTCVIFGGADVEDYSNIHIPEGAVVIAADRGYGHCLRLGIKPDCIIGDLDSNEEALPEDCEIITAPREKDDTDLMMAVKAAFDEHIRVFHIYGADGGRMGHTFASVQTLAYIDSHGGEGILHGNGFVMRVCGRGRVSLYNDGYKYVSLFSLSERSEIFAKGLKYGGDIVLKSDFPLGVSNEFMDNSAEIEVKSGKILVILEK